LLVSPEACQLMQPASPAASAHRADLQVRGRLRVARCTDTSKDGMAIDTNTHADRWADDEKRDLPVQRLTREQAQMLRARDPSVSPWRVVGTQVAVGAVAALLAAWAGGQASWGWSLLYGAAVVFVPGALMARGMTSPLSRMSPTAGVVSFMSWEFLKIGVSVLMLMLAPKFVQPLVWPALLVGLVLCIKVYWLALLWRPGRRLA
jgi:ATP synthase protein I